MGGWGAALAGSRSWWQFAPHSGLHRLHRLLRLCWVYKDINYSEDNAWKGTLTRCYKKKCHDTRERKRERAGEGGERKTDTYVQHVRPITIIFLTFTLFKLQGSVLASSFVVVVVIVSVSQCFTVTRRSNRLAVDLLPPTTWPPIHLPSWEPGQLVARALFPAKTQLTWTVLYRIPSIEEDAPNLTFVADFGLRVPATLLA